MKACFFATLAVPFLAFASGGPFKIMSYNIRHGVTSDKGFDLSRAACVMAAEKPRFVALQEIDMYTDRVGRTNSCEVLARFMGEKHSCATNWNFAKAIDYGGGEYGVVVKPSLTVATVLNIIYVFNSFPIVWTITKGDPANRTDTLVTYLYKLAFYNGKQGEAAAVSVIGFLILLVCASIYMVSTLKKGDE